MMNCLIQGNKVILLKEELEKMAEQNKELMSKHRSQLRRLFYAGRLDVITDILKQFEELEGGNE